jgi:NAD(P)-dependent dehydrogenase (short-subunit alcohol dehydrogenase family)
MTFSLTESCMFESSTHSLRISDAFKVAGMVTIVTGAAGRIGHGVAEVLAANQAKVVLSDRDEPRLQGALAQCQGHGGDCCAISADLTNPDQLRSLVDNTVSRFGRLDALVNCGAITSSDTIDRETVASFDRIYHTNLRSAWLLTKWAVEPMKSGNGGSIVNIASINGYRAQFPCSLYASGKAAMLAMTRELAVELAPHNIRVNSISPGLIATLHAFLNYVKPHLTEPYAQRMFDEVPRLFSDSTETYQPLRRSGRPCDIAFACLYLCSPAAGFVTGTDLIIDGGKNQESLDERMHQPTQPSFSMQTRKWLFALPPEAWTNGIPDFVERYRSRVMGEKR